jgi:hypothetical protein
MFLRARADGDPEACGAVDAFTMGAAMRRDSVLTQLFRRQMHTHQWQSNEFSWSPPRLS